MNQAEQQLQDALTTNFLTNLAFLSDYDRELYLRIDGLSQVINNGEYTERYFLEFIKTEGEFDIYDKNEDKYVYGKNPKKLINKAKNLDFTSKGSFSNLKRGICQGEKVDIDFDINEPVSVKNSVKIIMNDISEYVDVLEDKIESYNVKRYKDFDKFIIIGTLLGRHLLNIHNKFKSKIYFICEENLELFRLSLFVLDYSQFLRDGSTIIFSIMDDDRVFDNKIVSFLNYKSYDNYCVKFFTTDYNVSNLFDKIATAFTSNNPFAYNYASSLYNLANNDSKIIGKYNRINIRNITTELTNSPVIFVGAGPSLTEEIQWLYENQDKFIIVAMAATLSRLIKHNIIPDIISTVDSGEKIVLKQFDLENNLEYIKDKIILASSMTSHNILKNFKDENVFTFDVMSSFSKESLFYTAYSVGEMTLSWLLSLKCKEIYLLGIDLALNQDTGETHISGYHSTQKMDLDDDEFFVQRGGFVNSDTMEVEGNFIDKVKTTRLFILSLKAMNIITESLVNEEQSLINLSRHGAKINKTTALKTSEVSLVNIDKNISILKSNLQKVSKNGLSKSDKENLEIEELFLNEALDFIAQSKNKKMDYSKFKNFLWELYELFRKNGFKLIASKRFLSLYFDSIFLYVKYCLNDKYIRKEDRKIEKVMTVLNKQLKSKIEDYLEYSKKVRNN